MVYGSIGMINVAHGDVFMIGSFIALITIVLLGMAGITWVPLALLIGVVLLMQLALAFGVWDYSEGYDERLAAPFIVDVENTQLLGLLIYDRYILLFQLAGLVLLVAMIGAIVLTMRHRKDVKRQDILAQMYRDPAKALELKDVKPGQGL